MRRGRSGHHTNPLSGLCQREGGAGGGGATLGGNPLRRRRNADTRRLRARNGAHRVGACADEVDNKNCRTVAIAVSGDLVLLLRIEPAVVVIERAALVAAVAPYESLVGVTDASVDVGNDNTLALVALRPGFVRRNLRHTPFEGAGVLSGLNDDGQVELLVVVAEG